MRYLKRFIIVGLWSVVTIIRAQTQNDAAQRGVTETKIRKHQLIRRLSSLTGQKSKWIRLNPCRLRCRDRSERAGNSPDH